MLGYDALLNDLEIEINDTILDQLQLGIVGKDNPRTILVSAQTSQDFACVGDCAVSMAMQGKELSAMPDVDKVPDMVILADMTMQMMSSAVMSFIENNSERARSVTLLLNGHDQYCEGVVRELVSHMPNRSMEQTISLIRICRNLERVAELAVTISEKVIFMSHVPAWKRAPQVESQSLIHNINAECVGGV